MASDEMINGVFKDPEGAYYLARQLGYLSDAGRAARLLKGIVDGGYFCYPQMASDPWLDPNSQEAIEVFRAEGGPRLLGEA